MARIEIGMKVRDVVTGFVGIVTGRTEHITGCDRMIVQPKVDKDGKARDSQWFDEPMLEVVGKSIIKEVTAKKIKKKPGGPKDIPVDGKTPSRS